VVPGDAGAPPGRRGCAGTASPLRQARSPPPAVPTRSCRAGAAETRLPHGPSGMLSSAGPHPSANQRRAPSGVQSLNTISRRAPRSTRPAEIRRRIAPGARRLPPPRRARAGPGGRLAAPGVARAFRCRRGSAGRKHRGKGWPGAGGRRHPHGWGKRNPGGRGPAERARSRISRARGCG